MKVNEFIKLKDGVGFNKLIEYGFEEDPVNCKKGDTYYHLNNYYIQVNDTFRITVNMLDRHIDILCLVNESGLYNIFNLKPLYQLITNGLVEVYSK